MKMTPVRITIFVAILALVLLAAALPGSEALAKEGQNPNVRFTIINYSHQPFSMNASGNGEYYNFEVPAYSKRIYIMPRASYSFTMEACTHTSSGVLDLNIFQTMHVPVCGGNAGAAGQKHHNIDVADYIKMVKIQINNTTWEPIRLYLRTIENHYYLNLDPREETTLIVPRDTYVYSFLACDDLQSGYYNARVYQPLNLKCK